MRRAAAAALALVVVAFAAPAFANPDGEFRKLSNEFIDHWISKRPHVATAVGIHQWDRMLEPVTESSLDHELEWVRAFQARLEQLAREQLSFDRALEYDVMKARLAREALELEVLRPYRNDPSAYIALIAESVQSMLQWDYGSLCSRLQRMPHRLRRIPEVLRAARVNLVAPSRVHTEIAIERFRDVLLLYRVDIPEQSSTCKNPFIQGDLSEADSTAAWAVQRFLEDLKAGLLPRAHDDFRLGRALLEQKLWVEELESMPLDSILTRAWRELDATRSRMATIAEVIAPGQDVAATLQAIGEVRPAESDLIDDIGERLERVRAFLSKNPIVSPPKKAKPEDLIVRATPRHRHGVTLASMEGPGVWDKRAKQGFYNVTHADPAWPQHERDDHYATLNRYSADLLSVRLAIPGRYYQSLAARHMESRVRQLFESRGATEGWGLYCEQMMVEQGFGDGDPRYELAQLHLALQQIGRLIVAISMHAEAMTFDDAVRLLKRRCLMASVHAHREAKRAMVDPTYFAGLLGKWRLLELRDEVMRGLGDRFRLDAFHDAVLGQGPSPLPVVRAGVLRKLGLTDVNGES